jgi:hypothetical protein
MYCPERAIEAALEPQARASRWMSRRSPLLQSDISSVPAPDAQPSGTPSSGDTQLAHQAAAAAEEENTTDSPLGEEVHAAALLEGDATATGAAVAAAKVANAAARAAAAAEVEADAEVAALISAELEIREMEALVGSHAVY